MRIQRIAGEAGAVCLDPKTGKPLWRLGEEALDHYATTVALGEDYLVTSGQNGDDLRRVEWEEGSFSAPYKKTPMRCYRMTPNKATLVWERPALGYVGKCVPLIRDGHMYAKVGGNVCTNWTVTPASSSRRCSIVCIELASGRITAVVNEASTCEWESYVGGDGIANHGWDLGQWTYAMFRADPEELRVLDPLQLPRKPHYVGWCCTPAYADGRLFLRTWDRLACYDLRMDERVVKAGEAMERNDSATALRLFSDACRDFEASVRREGIAGLSRMGGQAEPAFELLVELARDDIASSVRAAAVRALAPVMRARPERLIGLLEKADHPRARAAAAVALGAFDASDMRIVQVQTRALGDGDAAVRLAATEAMAGWKEGAAPAAAAPVLTDALRGKEWSRVAAAASALAAVDETREPLVVSVLTERLSGSDTNVSAECAMALAGLFPKAKREATRQAIVTVLSKELRTRMGTDGLMAENKDRVVTAGLLRALGAIGPEAKSATPVLRKALDDTSLGEAAADAWRRVMPGQPLPKPELDVSVELE